MMIPSELTSYDKRLRGLGSRGPNERAKGTRGEGKGESWAWAGEGRVPVSLSGLISRTHAGGRGTVGSRKLKSQKSIEGIYMKRLHRFSWAKPPNLFTGFFSLFLLFTDFFSWSLPDQYFPLLLLFFFFLAQGNWRSRTVNTFYTEYVKTCSSSPWDLLIYVCPVHKRIFFHMLVCMISANKARAYD